MSDWDQEVIVKIWRRWLRNGGLLFTHPCRSEEE